MTAAEFTDTRLCTVCGHRRDVHLPGPDTTYCRGRSGQMLCVCHHFALNGQPPAEIIADPVTA